ncbi:Protein of unknown function [Bacillus mycoides]|uniref:Uncharacterized protein n=2 Tax=Bacillus cereus group TaxID=86661 RepID=A0A1G4EW47_BACMY|nr:Protein of unknown function [Bacillus mycoides]
MKEDAVGCSLNE